MKFLLTNFFVKRKLVKKKSEKKYRRNGTSPQNTPLTKFFKFLMGYMMIAYIGNYAT